MRHLERREEEEGAKPIRPSIQKGISQLTSRLLRCLPPLAAILRVSGIDEMFHPPSTCFQQPVLSLPPCQSALTHSDVNMMRTTGWDEKRACTTVIMTLKNAELLQFSKSVEDNARACFGPALVQYDYKFFKDSSMS